MNKWLVGVGLVGVLIVIIGHYIPWFTQHTEFGGETSVTSLYGGIFGVPILGFGLFALFCVFGAAIIPTGRAFTSIATKIIGVFVAMCGVIILIGLADTFRGFQALADLSPTITLHPDYGFVLSICGVIFILMAGIFGMFPTEPGARRSFKSQKFLSPLAQNRFW